MEIEKVSLKVNGAPIELNQFAGQVIGNTVLGLVRSLKLDSFPEAIEIQVTATAPSPPE